MLEKMDKTWIRVLALAALMLMTVPVAAQAARDDGDIKDNVQKALNPYEDISIDVDEGLVILKGNVANSGDRAEALAKARAVGGVRDVKDEMRVVGVEDTQTVGEYVDDAAVTAKVKAEFLTTRGLDSGAISVDTRDGVVMLTGSVKNANQANMAEKSALEVSGVKRVDNRLAVGR